LRTFISALTSGVLVFTVLISIGTAAAQPDSRGPAVGKAIPKFSGPDQNGVIRTLDNIKGPKGAMIVFSRSADW
jgi:hypothetical protein